MLGGVGLAFLLSMATQGWAFQTSGQRLAERVRISMFGNMLRHGQMICDDSKIGKRFIRESLL